MSARIDNVRFSAALREGLRPGCNLARVWARAQREAATQEVATA